MIAPQDKTRSDPQVEATLSAWEDYCLKQGDSAGALAAARAAREHYPYQHLGDERMAMHYAYQLDAEPALQHSLRAISLAPFCHIAHSARALALFATEDFEAAARHAELSVKIEADPEDDWSPAGALLLSLSGDLEQLEQLFEARSKEHPRWPYAEFDGKLRAVARVGHGQSVELRQPSAQSGKAARPASISSSSQR